MRVDWAIPCRYVEVHNQGATLVGAGADLLVAPELPAPIQVLFAVRFVGAAEEMDGETQHEMLVRLFDPAGESMGEQGGQLAAGVKQLVPGYLAELLMPLGIVLNAEQSGTYGVEFVIDGNALRVPIHIVAQGELPDGFEG